MNVLSPQGQQLPSRRRESASVNSAAASSEMDATASDAKAQTRAGEPQEALCACFLLAIIAGFVAFVAFGQAIVPGIVAALIGALIGLLFADEHPTL